MTEKHIKKKSVLLVICEISVKITIDNIESLYKCYHLGGNTKSWRVCGITGNLINCDLECTVVQPLGIIIWQILLS